MTAFSIGSDSLTIMTDDGDVHMLDKSDKRFKKISGLLEKNPPDIEQALKVMDLKTAVIAASAGRVTIDEQGVRFEGKEVNGYMAERLAAMAGSGMDVSPWMRFYDNLMENPLPETREDIFKWMEHGKMPITEDGCIVGFKKVRQDYKDVHSGKFSNTVGSVLSMPRDQCDTSRHNTCSTGFHFCSADYLNHFSGQRVMVVKIDPRDVTAIPKDYNNSKARCCRYEVTGELSSQAAARHKVFQEPVMPEDPMEIPDLMAKTTPAKGARTKGPASPIGTKTSSRKIAANASQAKTAKPKASAKQSVSGVPKKAATTAKKSPSKTTKKSAPKSTTSKVTKAVTKATKTAKSKVAKVVDAVTDAVAAVVPEVAPAKKTKAPARKSKPKKIAPASKTTSAKTKALAKAATPKSTKAPAKKSATKTTAAKAPAAKKTTTAKKAPAKKRS